MWESKRGGRVRGQQEKKKKGRGKYKGGEKLGSFKLCVLGGRRSTGSRAALLL